MKQPSGLSLSNTLQVEGEDPEGWWVGKVEMSRR